jgi:hypothetical protein
MRLGTKLAISNGLMALGLLSYLIVSGYFTLTSSYRGDAAMAAAMVIMLGLVLSFVIVLVVSFPAALWSRSLVKSAGVDTLLPKLLRFGVFAGVIAGGLPLLVFSPVAASLLRALIH